MPLEKRFYSEFQSGFDFVTSGLYIFTYLSLSALFMYSFSSNF